MGEWQWLFKKGQKGQGIRRWAKGKSLKIEDFPLHPAP
jgi:hypothetical protein